MRGIYIQSSDHNILINNTSNFNYWSGIRLENANYNDLMNLLAASCGVFV